MSSSSDNKIAIIGLGYVGLPLAAAFGNIYETVGFDIDKERVKQLKSYEINAYILDDKDGPMVKISGATLYNDAEAEKELQRIRKEINPEAYKKAYKILK